MYFFNQSSGLKTSALWFWSIPSSALLDVELLDTDWLLICLKIHLFIIETKNNFNTSLQNEKKRRICTIIFGSSFMIHVIFIKSSYMKVIFLFSTSSSESSHLGRADGAKEPQPPARHFLLLWFCFCSFIPPTLPSPPSSPWSWCFHPTTNTPICQDRMTPEEPSQ